MFLLRVIHQVHVTGPSIESVVCVNEQYQVLVPVRVWTLRHTPYVSDDRIPENRPVNRFRRAPQYVYTNIYVYIDRIYQGYHF